MKNSSLSKTLMVAISIIFFCSLMVSSAVSILRPIQTAHKAPQQFRTILLAAGLVSSADKAKSEESMGLFQQIEPRILALSDAKLAIHINEQGYDYRQFIEDPNATTPINKKEDLASLGRRPNYMPIYWVHSSLSKAKIVLPIYGKGMWSMIHGYIALEQDLNTIVGLQFYDLAETPGIGDRILDKTWLDGWLGKQLYDAQGNLVFKFGNMSDSTDQMLSRFQVDGITGATKTVDALANIIEFWFGENGYGPFLEQQSIKNQDTEG